MKISELYIDEMELSNDGVLISCSILIDSSSEVGPGGNYLIHLDSKQSTAYNSSDTDMPRKIELDFELSRWIYTGIQDYRQRIMKTCDLVNNLLDKYEKQNTEYNRK